MYISPSQFKIFRVSSLPWKYNSNNKIFTLLTKVSLTVIFNTSMWCHLSFANDQVVKTSK